MWRPAGRSSDDKFLTSVGRSCGEFKGLFFTGPRILMETKKGYACCMLEKSTQVYSLTGRLPSHILHWPVLGRRFLKHEHDFQVGAIFVSFFRHHDLGIVGEIWNPKVWSTLSKARLPMYQELLDKMQSN